MRAMPAQRRGGNTSPSSTADARMPVHGDSSDGRNGPEHARRADLSLGRRLGVSHKSLAGGISVEKFLRGDLIG